MFSIIIPLYNKAQTIVHTLQTVMSQTEADFEVIIVDDGSTDDGVAAINRHFNDARIRIIRQCNQGVSEARNTGIKNANGAYLSFLDADDEWLPEYLAFVTRAINRYPQAGIYIAGRYTQNIQTRQRSANIPPRQLGRIQEISFFANPHVYMHISATTVKATLLQDNTHSWGSFIKGQKSNEDFTFLFRVALHTPCVYIGIPLSIYNGGVEGQATSTLSGRDKMDNSILFRNKVWEEWQNTGCKNKEFKIFMKYEIRHSVLQLIRQADNAGIAYLLKGIRRYHPLFTSFELHLYHTPATLKLAQLFILFSKVIWRSHRYPVVK